MKGLLIDYGGVLTTSVLDAFAAFARMEGLEPEALGSAMRAVLSQPDNLFHSVEVGEIDTDEFEILLANEIGMRCGIPVEPVGLKMRLFAAATADDRMLGMLRAARAQGIKTCLVSNSWGITGGGYPVDAFPELFDATVLSGEVQMRKPDAQIYLLAAERIGVDPKECVFIDDFKINVEGAEAVGMTGIHHKDTDETVLKLEALFNRTL